MSRTRKSKAVHCITCNRTRKDGAKFNRHHVTYRCEGGSNDPSNLVWLCTQCHVNLHSTSGDFKRWGGQGGSKAARNPYNMRRLRQFRDMTDHEFNMYLYQRELAGIVARELPAWLERFPVRA